MGFLNTIKEIVKADPIVSESTPIATSATPLKKVLIVEDEKSISDALVEVFKSEGFDAITAENGKVGLEVIAAQKPEIVLLDLMMPVMDGKTMLMKLRDLEEFKKLPVIILTNAGDAENMKDTKLYGGASEFLIKANVNMGELVQKVKMHVSTY